MNLLLIGCCWLTSGIIVLISAADNIPSNTFKILKSSHATANSTTSKPYTLAVLGLLSGFYQKPNFTIESCWWFDDKQSRCTPTGIDTMDLDSKLSRGCVLESLQWVLDIAAENRYMLADYDVELYYYDGDIIDAFLPRLLIEFIDTVTERQKQEVMTNSRKKTVISPLSFGPNFGCQWAHMSILKYIMATFLNNFNVVNFFTQSCGHPVMGVGVTLFRKQRRALEVESMDIVLQTMVAFSIENKWRQVAIVGGIENAFNTRWIVDLNRILTENDIHAVDIEVLKNKNHFDVFSAIRRSRARIIIFTSSYMTCEDCVVILCSSRRAGIRSPKFVILFWFTTCGVQCLNFESKYLNKAYLSLSSEAVCSKSDQWEQAKIMIFFTPKEIADTEAVMPYSIIARLYANSNLYGGSQPNALFRRQGSSQCSQEMQAHYRRFPEAPIFGDVTDVLTATLLVLNASDKNPLSTEAVDQNAAEWEFLGSLSGIDYINVHKIDIKQVTADSNDTMRELVSITPISSTSPGSVLRYTYNVTNSTIWSTPHGRPPKDLSNVEHRSATHNETATLILLTACSFIFAFQVIIFGVAAIAAKKPRRKRKAKLVNAYFDFGNNSILLVGCLILTVSALTLVTGTAFYPEMLCYFRPVLVVIGLAVVSGTLSVRMWMMPQFAHECRYITQKKRKPNLFNLKFHEQEMKSKLALQSKKVKQITGAIVATSSLLAAVWLASDPIKLKVLYAYEDDPLFDLEGDTYYDLRIEWCESSSQLYLFGAFTVINAVTLLFSCIRIVTLKSKIKFVRKRFLPEISSLRMAVYNCMTILVFTILLMVVLPTKPPEIAYIQVTVFAACLLLYSASTSGILFFRFWSPVMLFHSCFPGNISGAPGSEEGAR